MILRVVEAPKSYYLSLLNKLRRSRRLLMDVHVIKRGGEIYVMGSCNGLSAAFIYCEFMKAAFKGLKAELMAAKPIDSSILPREVRELSEKWRFNRLNKREVKLLKNMRIAMYKEG